MAWLLDLHLQFFQRFKVRAIMKSQEIPASLTCTEKYNNNTATPCDPELHYDSGDDDALHNILATWPENFFSSLPKATW